MTVVALGFGFSSAAPAHAYNFFTTQAQFDAGTTSQSPILFNGASDVTVGNPVVGNVGANLFSVSSTYAGNLDVSNANSNNPQIRGIRALDNVPVDDFTVSGKTGGALFFSIEGTVTGGMANILVGSTVVDTVTLPTNNGYFGIAGLGGGSSAVTIEGVGSEQLHVLKDLQVGSPVPEFSSLLGLGGLLAVGGFAGLRRRKVLG
jgi:hypothetical protein